MMHTPGPWEVIEEHGEREICGGTSRTGSRVVLATINEYWDLAENDANARLIAEAPDLLAALEDTQEGIDDLMSTDCAAGMYESLYRLRLRIAPAIAAAKGE